LTFNDFYKVVSLRRKQKKKSTKISAIKSNDGCQTSNAERRLSNVNSRGTKFPTESKSTIAHRKAEKEKERKKERLTTSFLFSLSPQSK